MLLSGCISLKWLYVHLHINYKTDKAWTRVNIMRKLKLKLESKPLETIYGCV